MRFTALLGAHAEGGKVSATNDGLVINGADEVTLIVSAGTDWNDKEYANRARQRHCRG
jgi:alpha-L-fucosidase 2